MFSVISACISDESTGSPCLDDVLVALNASQLQSLCVLVKNWNANSRFSFVCQSVIDCIVRRFPVDFFTANLVASTVPSLLSYSERHYQRLDRLGLSCSMLDYAIFNGEHHIST